jgi:hypothetical protein
MFVETLKYIDTSTYREVFSFTGNFVIPRVGEKIEVLNPYADFIVEDVVYYHGDGFAIVYLRNKRYG